MQKPSKPDHTEDRILTVFNFGNTSFTLYIACDHTYAQSPFFRRVFLRYC